VRAATIVLVLLVLSGAHGTLIARASTPSNIAIEAPLSLDEPRISWNEVPGTAEYRLTGTIAVARVNAENPFCRPPLEEDRRTITLSDFESLAVTEFELALPELPPEDAWFFLESRVQVQAFDEDAVLLASGSVGGIAETAVCTTPTIEPVLPKTGQGGDPEGYPIGAYLLIAGVAAGAAFGALVVGLKAGA
jgi:hypothetical protein